MSKPPAFHLSKWYADVISDCGDAVILYHGVARWHGVAHHYSSFLKLIGNMPAHAQYALRKTAAPSFSGSCLHWASPSLGIEGTWASLDPPHSETVFASGDGIVEWHCWQPRARVTLHFAPGQTLAGLGYSERVDMTIPPWQLPIQQLQWGRFLCSDHSLVWMDWRGPFTKRVLLHNGRVVDGDVSADQVSFGSDAKLTFAQRVVLRRGGLGSVALGKIPGLRTLLPSRVLEVQENKWRSRAHLTLPAAALCGWSIHEIVTWPS